MKVRLLFFLIILIVAPLGRAQFGSFGDVPVEINAEGGTRFENGVAVAENNVVIQYGAATIYCDYAEYNPETRDVLVRGNVRIYRQGFVFVGDRAVYNLETKQLHAADIKGDFYPFVLGADTLASLRANAFQSGDAAFTTSDSSKPDYYLRAKTARIYAKDHIVLENVFLYVGQTPVFWWPYVYQPIDNDVGYRFVPGYHSNWGAFLLTGYTFPIGEIISATVKIDGYARRGAAIGLDSKFKFGKDEQSWVDFRSYYIHDQQPNINQTGLDRVPIGSDRYRVTFKDRFYIADDIYTSIDINKLSDQYVVQDFMPGEFQLDPQPDNYIALTKWADNYTLTGVARAQLNTFFDTTERLPEFALDLKTMPIFNSPVFYEGETSVGKLARTYPNTSNTSTLINYSATRVDSYHQLLFPHVYGGWFSFTPKVGIRGTYYSNSYDNAGQATGDTFRTAANAGFEASFKISREFEQVTSRTWGLDGLRHVIQPYTDLSYVYSNRSPANIYQFDRYTSSTQLPSIDFPEFRSIDAIGSWAVWQYGVRNRFQTRRDGETLNWLELDTFFDLNIKEPYLSGVDYQAARYSNLYNNLRWNPLPWLSLQFNTALPVFTSGGFTEINTDLGFTLTRDIRLDLSQRYINNNPYFNNSNLVTASIYVRLNENWGVRISEQYEAVGSLLEAQRYEIFRDLSSWIASVGLVVTDNRNGAVQCGVLFTLTLKDMPQAMLPFNFNPQFGGGK